MTPQNGFSDAWHSAPGAQQTPCQTCCAPGGDCSKASKGQPGICCGSVEEGGLGFCCPSDAKCHPCASSYRCFRGIKVPRDICAYDGGNMNVGEEVADGSAIVGFLFIMIVVFMLCSPCRRRRAAVPITHNIAMNPVPVGQAVGGVPMGSPVTSTATAGGVPVVTAQPVCYPGGQAVTHVHHPGGYGYGGGNVAMGAGMGFLGGMMMGEMMTGGMHGGDYGGGDYGGGGGDGGGFAADM